MKFKQNSRSRVGIAEFAAKQLPAHPVTRYRSFPPLWKATRQKGKHIPIPKNDIDDLFPCCFLCQLAAVKDFSTNELLWRRKTNIQWLRGEWKWDFGHTLPPEFVKYGVGSAPPLSINVDRVFVFDESFNRKMLDLNLEQHAVLKGGEAKMLIVDQPLFFGVAFEGQMIAGRYGTIAVAIARDIVLGEQISQKFVFQTAEMDNQISNLLFAENIDKIDNSLFFKNEIKL